MKQVKSKKRVSKHGEVFTNEREVEAMLDLVQDSFKTIDSTFLEPSIGEGNFAIKILERKLSLVESKYAKQSYSYSKTLIRAVASIYGIELLTDNVITCRKRMYDFVSLYTNSKKTLKTIQMILEKNIINGNTLTMKTINDEPITFIEWKYYKNKLIGVPQTLMSMIS
ncbi:MAG: hypothetical protein NC310_07115 [Roseburia sp.]|nr:hypothetical protein [Anaeroplasma bactoclasticum]MCM1196818.1 hypothetical protein [Roseburia sp.]MCM1556954.1 hypothetical protein [Anaeroplasma bactoclasticum]